jgi:hypothetical protein
MLLQQLCKLSTAPGVGFRGYNYDSDPAAEKEQGPVLVSRLLSARFVFPGLDLAFVSVAFGSQHFQPDAHTDTHTCAVYTA